MSEDVLLNDSLGKFSKDRLSIDVCIKVFDLNDIIFVEWELNAVIDWIEVLIVFLRILESDHVNKVL